MAMTVQCGVCLDTKGMCTAEKQMQKSFHFTLREGFQEKTVLPCYGRSVLLRKYNVKENERKIFFASFLTPQKFLFEFRVTNEPNKTSIDGDAWKEYCRVYQLEMHQQVYFSIKKMGFDPSGAVCENLPIIHPSYYLLGGRMRDIVDRITSTVGTMFNWKMMGKVIEEVGKLERFVDHHDAGDYDLGRSYALLHTLNKSNCTKNFMKLPRRLIPEGMTGQGAITLVCDPKTRLSSSYTISADENDGRMCINRWDHFMKSEANLKEGHKLLMILYIGDHGNYLFVSHVPDMALDK